MLDQHIAQSRKAAFDLRYSRFIRAVPAAEDALARELAEAAYMQGRPSFIGRGGYHAQKHVNAVNRANKGDELRFAIEREYDYPLRFEHLAGIAPLNLPAAQALDEAYASLGRRISLPKLWARQLGEF